MNPPETMDAVTAIAGILSVFSRLTGKMTAAEREKAQREVEELCAELLKIYREK